VSNLGVAAGFSWLTAIWRLTIFLAVWLVLAGADPVDLPAGIAATVVATWTSMRLLPPGRWRVSPTALLSLTLRFFRQSIAAGFDIAWRALDPRLPLNPGFIVYPTRLPQGPALNTFCTFISLAPGTLPVGQNASGAIVVHCLDVSEPVAAHLAADDRLLTRALGGK
jgi:multicomponent Na+:H+ antiporter subunit E